MKKILVLDAGGYGGYGVSSRQVGRFDHRPPTADELDANDRARDLRAARLAAGLDESGMASYATSRSTGAYDPEDPADCERVRKIIRQEDGDVAADSWQPHPGATDTRDQPPEETERRPTCYVCGARFPTYPPLRRHFELHHPDEDPPPEPEPPVPTPVPEPDLVPDEPVDEREAFEDDEPPAYSPPAKTPPWLRD